MGLKQALNELNAAIQDLSSLHVRTYSGTLNLEINGQGDRAKALDTAIKSAAGNAKLALETFVCFDGDTYHFVGDDVEDSLRTMHKDAIEAGLKTRQGLMDMVAGWFD